jgi:hypothetical protein
MTIICGGGVGRSKTAAVKVEAPEERPGRPTSIDPAVAALLDHIAEDMAREYVRLMERAAEEDRSDHPRKEREA